MREGDRRPTGCGEPFGFLNRRYGVELEVWPDRNLERGGFPRRFDVMRGRAGDNSTVVRSIVIANKRMNQFGGIEKTFALSIPDAQQTRHGRESKSYN